MLVRPCANGLTSALRVRRHGHQRALKLVAARSVASQRLSSSNSPNGPDVAILGGGISGLAAAHFLLQRKPGAKITIYEASDRIGGWLQSTRVPVHDGSVLFEGAIRTLRPSGNGALAAKLIQDLDMVHDTIFTNTASPAARNRYVYYPDHLVRMPHPSFGIVDNFWKLLTEPAFKTAAFAALKEPLKDARDETLADESIGAFLSRRLNSTVVDNLVSAVIHGIYAGDIYKLSARSLFPIPWRDEAVESSVFMGMVRASVEGYPTTKRNSEFAVDARSFVFDPTLTMNMAGASVFTFKEGTQMLADRLALSLARTGQVEFKVETPAQAISLAQGNKVELSTKEGLRQHTHVISALSPGHLNQVWQGSEKGAKQDLLVPEIPTVTVMTVNLYFRTPDLHPPGFGYLIPRAVPFEQNPERALGVVFDTAYSPEADTINDSELEARGVIASFPPGTRLGGWNMLDDFNWFHEVGKPSVQDHVKSRGTKVTVMLGGHWWDGWSSFPDEQEGLAMARALLERHLGIKEEPEAWKVNMQKDCIPQYVVGHEAKLKQAHENLWREFKGKLRVVGNWMSGVGMNDCLRSAWDVAKHFDDAGTGLEQAGEPLDRRILLKPKKEAKE